MDQQQVITLGALGGLLLLCFSGFGFLLVSILGVAFYFLYVYIQGGQCDSEERLLNKVVVITGGNTGIGKETALDLSKRGAKIIIGCRNTEKGEQAASEIRSETGRQVVIYPLDLADFKSVRAFAKTVASAEPKIDILINNAGVMMCPNWKTVDGFDMQWQTNHLGHFLLTNLLLPNIKKAAPSRIVNVSSLAHQYSQGIDWEDINFEKTTYSSTRAYTNSKLANVLFTKELAKKLKGSGVTTYSLHPGVVDTELSRHVLEMLPAFMVPLGTTFFKLFYKTAKSGAQTSIFCAVDKSVANESGKYYSDCKEKEPSKHANNEDSQKKLWEISEKSVKLNEVEEVKETIKEDAKISESSSSSDVEESFTKLEVERIEASVPEASSVAQPQHEELVREARSAEEDISDEEISLESSDAVENILKKLHEASGENKPAEPIPKDEEEPKKVDTLAEKATEAILKQVEKFSSASELKKVETTEKVVLPDKYDILVEKSTEAILKEVESFSSTTELKKVETEEKVCLPDKYDILVEKSSEAILKEVVSFSTVTELKKVETEERVVLPDKYDILKEKSSEAFLKEFETFSPIKDLKKVETEERVVLPDKYDILKEKSSEAILKEFETFSPIKDLKKVETQEKDVLPDKYDILMEKSSEAIFKEVESFSTATELKKVVTEEKVVLPDKYDILVEKSTEAILKEVESFSTSTDLKKVDTEEKNVLPDKYDILKEKSAEGILKEVPTFSATTELRKVITEEKIVLPGQQDIAKEKTVESLLKEVKEFSTTELTHVTPIEPNPLVLVRRESLNADIEKFQRTSLKLTETNEEFSLPTEEDMKLEKEVFEEEVQHNKASFTEVVKTLEESFSETKEGLKHVEVDTKTVLPDKIDLVMERAHAEVLAQVPQVQLKQAPETRESSAVEIAKTEISRTAALEQVAAFDKQTLKPTTTEEKIVLPDQTAIAQERSLDASDCGEGSLIDFTASPVIHVVHPELLQQAVDREPSAEGSSNSDRSRNSSTGSGETGSSKEWEKVENPKTEGD